MPRSLRHPSPAFADAAVPGGRHRQAETPRSPVGGPRHAATARSDGRRSSRGGSHRAPGTWPVESWLLVGSKRQQILLASLVAAALLLIALPIQRNGIDAVNAAVAGAAGTHVQGKHVRKVTGKAGRAASGSHTPSPTPKPSVSTATHQPAGEVKLPTGLGPGHSLRTTGGPAIALTFDDGPDPVQTPRILALLAAYHIKATFCLIGQNVEKHPEIVRKIVAAGHTLCNHTWNHSLTIGLQPPAAIQADLARTTAAIQAAAPGARVPFFRAPGGNFTDRLVTVAMANGMTSLYWAVDPRDWDHPAGETDAVHIARVIAQVRKFVKPGSIILSHDFNQPDTIAAYTMLLPWLAANFTFTIPAGAGTGAPPPSTSPASPSPSASPTATTPTPDPSDSAELAPAESASVSASTSSG